MLPCETAESTGQVPAKIARLCLESSGPQFPYDAVAATDMRSKEQPVGGLGIGVNDQVSASARAWFGVTVSSFTLVKRGHFEKLEQGSFRSVRGTATRGGPQGHEVGSVSVSCCRSWFRVVLRARGIAHELLVAVACLLEGCFLKCWSFACGAQAGRLSLLLPTRPPCVCAGESVSAAADVVFASH